MQFFTLNNGNKLPSICFGPGIMTRGMKRYDFKLFNYITKKITERSYYHSIMSAFLNGFRFVDYSISYGREDLISKAIKKIDIPRDQLFLTTRVDNYSQFQGNVRESVLKSLKRYGVEYVDLLMFHWPVPGKYISTWKELIKLQEDGLCKNIGVANCNEHHLQSIIDETSVVPQINQFEIHPLFSQKNLVEYCKSKCIQVEAYTPLARLDERIYKLPVMKSLSLKYNKSISQIILRWHVQNGIIPVFRSLNSNRQKENIEIFDFVLSEDDMGLIDGININSRLRFDPDNCDFTIL